MVATTRHGRKRLRKRVGIPEKAAIKMARRAFQRGITHSEACGPLKLFLNNLWLSQRNCNNMRIYGDNVYMFAGETLVTVITVPCDLRKIANEIIRRRTENANANGS